MGKQCSPRGEVRSGSSLFAILAAPFRGMTAWWKALECLEQSEWECL